MAFTRKKLAEGITPLDKEFFDHLQDGIEEGIGVCLKGKTVYSFGDSLLAGHYNNVGFIDYLATKNEMKYTKYAVNGLKVLDGSILAKVNGASATIPDFIVFDGLTNDAYDENLSKLGAISDSYEGSYNTATFYGAFENLCYKLKTKYPGACIIYVTPHRMPTRSMAAQDKLCEIAKEVCAKWAIPVVDIHNEGTINTWIDTMRNDYSYNQLPSTTGGNGTHLNEDGYRLFYAPMIERKMRECCGK